MSWKKLSSIFLWLSVLVILFVNWYLAGLTWNEVRLNLGWVKNIPQQSNFKLRHFVQFSPQTFWVALVIQYSLTFSHRKNMFLAIVIIAISGGVSEIIQVFSPTRIPSILDVFWNLCAALVGAFGYHLYYLFMQKKCTSQDLR